MQSGPGRVVGSWGTRGAVFCAKIQWGGKTRQQSRGEWGEIRAREQGEEGVQGKSEVCSNVRERCGTLAGTGLALPWSWAFGTTLPWQWVGACPSLWPCPVRKALHNPSRLLPHASMIPSAS